MYSRNRTLSFGILLLLLILVAIAGFALNKIQTLSLPISSVTAVATLLLPILNGGGIGGAQYLVTGSGTSNRERKAPQSWLIIFTLLFLVIYEAVIATLTFVHIAPPSDLVCGLERTWGRLYSNKDEWAIKRIQEVHQCCGLHTVKDKAWPFADKKLDRGNDACLKAFGRQKACLGEWRRDEQISAGLLFMVALTLILLKLLILVFFRTGKPWISHAIGYRRFMETASNDEDEPQAEQSSRKPKRIEGRYRDSPALADNDDDEEATLRPMQTRTTQNESTEDAAEGSVPIVQPSSLHVEENQCRR